MFFIVKESLVDLSRQLQEALAKESLVQKSKSVHSKITTEQLKTMTEHFRYTKTASQINISSFSDFQLSTFLMTTYIGVHNFHAAQTIRTRYESLKFMSEMC